MSWKVWKATASLSQCISQAYAMQDVGGRCREMEVSARAPRRAAGAARPLAELAMPAEIQAQDTRDVVQNAIDTAQDT